VPQIEVKFDINGDGILSVSAKDKGTGKEQKIVVQSGSGLARDEIDRMVDDARVHEAEDQRRRSEVETRNQADSLVYGAEQMLEENKDKIPEDVKQEVEAKLAALKAAIAANDAAEIQRTMGELNSAMQRMGQAVYSQAGGGGPHDAGAYGGDAPPGDGGAPGGQPDGGTVDGEFREV
jgi:molecular chaperone DnaK